MRDLRTIKGNEFIWIDSFSEMVQPLVMIGHTGAEVGLYKIKEADIYDYAVGDVFQYSYYSNSAGPFEPSVSYFETFTVAQLTEDESEKTYTFDVHRLRLTARSTSLASKN